MVATLNPRFVFLQAYHVGKDEASSYANPRFANYRRALQRLGLLHGAYLRCHANAETLIRKFLAVYSPQIGDILPTLDIEEDYDNRCSLPVQKRVNQIEEMIQLVSTRMLGIRWRPEEVMRQQLTKDIAQEPTRAPVLPDPIGGTICLLF